ncbi:ATP-binding protein [Pseudoruegeria sp. HB172150]|uniref:ATP-binding protein n=1 Tax=Pseudoruegeria sp. HB172150 TaxID=2721164 RepID=UPI00155419E8|nr:ATP-binding protein [Pseudoruegeria sp. HB172150]
MRLKPLLRDVRRAIEQLTEGWRGGGASGPLLMRAELVAAEVLTNVVEHGFAGGHDGEIEVVSHASDKAVILLVRDNGGPMPGGAAPCGLAPEIPETTEELPEGGFGWYLIRSLTHRLDYCRRDGCNCLCVEIREEDGNDRPARRCAAGDVRAEPG